MNPQHRGLPEPDCATERRIYPAALVRLAGLPDKSGVPVGMAARLGGGGQDKMRPSCVAHSFWTLNPSGRT